MIRLSSLFCALAVAMTPVIAFASDLDKLQGTWETSFRQEGKTYRAVKTIQDQTETVEVFDGERLMKRHSVNFELDERDGIKTFTYRNGQITLGAGSPANLPDGKYIYRVDGDNWIGIHGAFSTDSGPVFIQVFKRVAEKKPSVKT